MSLAICKGAVITISIEGQDEEEGLRQIGHFIKAEIGGTEIGDFV